MKLNKLVLAAAMLLAFSPLVKADSFDITGLLNNQSNVLIGSFDILATTSGTQHQVWPFFGLTIASVTGTLTINSVGPATITGLLASDPAFTLDNDIVTVPVLGFDGPGLGFTVGTDHYNLYSVGLNTSGVGYYLSLAGAGDWRFNQGYPVTELTITSVTSVPDTASTLALFGLGLVVLGGARKFMGRLPTPI